MKAEIVSIGTELLLGSITDTNAAYLAQRLASLGIDCYYVSQVGDNLQRLVETLRRAWERSDLTVATGGLGPTQDDLTREAIAAMLGEEPRVVPELEGGLRAFFERRGAPMPDRNLKQATLIPSASVLANPVGTAPGWWVQREIDGEARVIISMPGVPFEMKRMWENEAEPRLRPFTSTVISSRTLKVIGMGESAVEELVADLMQGSNPTLAPYAKRDGVHLRITAKATDVAAAKELISALEEQVRSRLGSAIYGTDDETSESVAAKLVSSSGLSLALLEVGEGAIGSIVPRLSDLPALLGCVVAPTLDAAARLIGAGVETSATQGIEGLARGLQAKVGADLLLAVTASVTPLMTDETSVQADVEILLLRAEGLASTVARAAQSWRTSMSEVPRLAGLAALNLLLKSLGSEARTL